MLKSVEMARRIPDSGINLFQLIYVLLREYKEKTGQEPLNLSLGNPDGVPVAQIRELEARFALDAGYDYHTYAEDKNLLGFAEGMVSLHGGISLEGNSHLEAYPIAGIKTASALIPLACGAGKNVTTHVTPAIRKPGSSDSASAWIPAFAGMTTGPGQLQKNKFSFASNLPAYDIVGTWGEKYLGGRRIVWPLLSSDNMRLNLKRLREAVARSGQSRVDLVFTVRPGNPAAVGASVEDWRELIAYCLDNGTRLANDAAYAGLAQGAHVPLAAVAKDYPNLEWVELYSVSKSFNDPGARLGAIVGSRDFVRDYLMIKGNADSGPAPSLMAAYGEFFKNMDEARRVMGEIQSTYQRRLNYVVPLFKKAGLIPACETEAGFFTLWKVPRRVLGIDLSKDERTRNFPLQEAFNRLVISETGLMGVHFPGFNEDLSVAPLIRYAVCADVFDPQFQTRFEAALSRLNPEY